MSERRTYTLDDRAKQSENKENKEHREENL